MKTVERNGDTYVARDFIALEFVRWAQEAVAAKITGGTAMTCYILGKIATKNGQPFTDAGKLPLKVLNQLGQDLASQVTNVGQHADGTTTATLPSGIVVQYREVLGEDAMDFENKGDSAAFYMVAAVCRFYNKETEAFDPMQVVDIESMDGRDFVAIQTALDAAGFI